MAIFTEKRRKYYGDDWNRSRRLCNNKPGMWIFLHIAIILCMIIGFTIGFGLFANSVHDSDLEDIAKTSFTVLHQ